jgi:hypothetical protein
MTSLTPFLRSDGFLRFLILGIGPDSLNFYFSVTLFGADMLTSHCNTGLALTISCDRQKA